MDVWLLIRVGIKSKQWPLGLAINTFCYVGGIQESFSLISETESDGSSSNLLIQHASKVLEFSSQYNSSGWEHQLRLRPHKRFWHRISNSIWVVCPYLLSHFAEATFTHARSGCGAEAGGFWYSRSATAGMFTHTRSGRGRICHFLRTMMVWSTRFQNGRGKLGVGPISFGAVFAPAPPPLRDRACVNACNDLCSPPASARACVNVPWWLWNFASTKTHVLSRCIKK